MRFSAARAGIVLVALSVSITAPPAARAGTNTSAAPELLSTPHPGWLWSDPAPQGNALEAVEFAGETGFASGEDGTVLRSSDGGRTWSSLATGTEEKLSQLQVLDANTLYTSGQFRLLESSDGGASFRQLHYGPCSYECTELASFSFLNATSGFVETETPAPKRDTLLWTEDGGAHFQPRTPIPLYAADPGPIRFLSATEGLALVGGTDLGRVMRTVDGGHSWAIAAEVLHKLSALTFATPQVAYAVGEDDTLLRSDDAGASWKPMPLQLPAGTEPLSLTTIACGGPENCLIGTTPYRAFTKGPTLLTSDGGRTASFAGTIPGADASSYTSTTEAVAVGLQGATGVSVDAGTSFTENPFRPPLVSVPYEVGASHLRPGRLSGEAYLPGEKGLIAATHDGGQTWQALKLPTRATVLDVAFPSPETGYALLAGGKLLATADGGLGWRSCGAAAGSLGTLLAPAAGLVLVTGEHGIWPGEVGIWRSTDHCAHFAHLRGSVGTGAHSRPLRSINLAYGGGQVIDGHTVIVYGHEALESTDAGKHWQLIPHPRASGAYEAASFPTPRAGYAIVGGTLYSTRDRGRHWRRVLAVPPAEDDFAPSISFNSAREGFIATYNDENQRPCMLFRTDDAGRSWVAEEMPRPITNVLARPGISYAASNDGGLFITHSRGESGKPSRITLRISRPSRRSRHALSRANGDATVEGRITPAISGVPITVAYTTGSGWTEESTVTGDGGKFSETVGGVEETTWFDAYWSGGPDNRGSVAGPVKLSVRP